ncbi:MAG TPA: TPM domain-containing protein [Vicinamibacterales bacterium]
MATLNTLLLAFLVLVFLTAPRVTAQELPELTQPVNDFARVVDPSSAASMDSVIRSLERASGDVVVVATVESYAPYADIREYAVKLFENRGRGIGQRGRDNGLLVLLAVKEREVQVEVGYDLEQFITDGFAGETSRQYMAPAFRRGEYGAGLAAGVSRIATRIAEGRNVTLQGVPRDGNQDDTGVGTPGGLLLTIFIAFIVLNALAAGTRRHRRFGRQWGGPIGGWSSGVGPFGGGFGGFGGRGGGFGGGFGGFGGGRSGGGGGGARW